MDTVFSNELLVHYGAKLVVLGKGVMLFSEGEPATHFYIVKSGRVKMQILASKDANSFKDIFQEGRASENLPSLQR